MFCFTLHVYHILPINVYFCSTSNFETNTVYNVHRTYIHLRVTLTSIYLRYIFYSKIKITTEDRTFQNWFCLFIRCVSCHCFVYIFKHVSYQSTFDTLFKVRHKGISKCIYDQKNIGRSESNTFFFYFSKYNFQQLFSKFLCKTKLDLLMPKSGLERSY